MFNIRVCAVAAGLAFVISLLTGLISGSTFPAFILRPVLFAVVFFGLAALINILISRFLPELLDGSEAGTNQAEKFSLPGENLNISEDDFGGQGAALADDSDEDVGDISAINEAGESHVPHFSDPDDNVAEGLDQNLKDGYNTEEGVGSFTPGFDIFSGNESLGSSSFDSPFPDEKQPAEKMSKKHGGTSAHGSSSSGGGAVDDILMDLDSMANVFTPSPEPPSAGASGGESFSDSLVKKPGSGGKGQKFDWDFNPKDMAQGIRTKISKEG